jgi:small redox-active disulfide protein 2
MNIKILGPGCVRCHQLEKTTREVVKELGIDTSVEEVKDMRKIIAYNILTTPGLVINEQVVSSGRVPTKAEVTQLIINAVAKEEQKKGD